ncbi:FAD/NAD(P)-binding domain-containing protein [Stipitochalara longipes BDJ]|nr:FAD/NAD(P)-binding domain-containing protein [Stipitochalara longipes BDJ]
MAKIELDIIVIGAGIAGLAAAISLSRAGHNVTVLEKSTFKQEAGFMITIGPTGVAVLSSLGFDFPRARPSNTNFVATFDGETLEQQHNLEIRPHSWNSQGAKTFYRPDLHSELKRLCLLESSEYKSPKLILGSEVVSVDIDKGIVTLANGSLLSGDLLIGADGERSIIKAAFNDPNTLRQAPYRIFRAIVPTEALISDDRQWSMLQMTKSMFAIFTKGKRNLSWFEGRDGLLQDLEAGYNLSLDTDPMPETDPVKAKQKMLDIFSDYHPVIVAALREAERVSDWEVFHASPLSHLHKGRALLIGDAAHSMFPTTGQGGTQSLEDVCALSVLLHSDSLRKGSELEIRERLGIYEGLRKGRMSVVQGCSGITFGSEREVGEQRPWHVVNKAGIASGEEHLSYLYQYDIFEESRKALDQGLRARARL